MDEIPERPSGHLRQGPLGPRLEATPQLKEDLAFSIDSLQNRPAAERTISTFRHILESFDPKYGQVLSPYCRDGNFGQIFDAAEDQVAPTQWTLIEMGRLMQMGPAVIVPALFYLFRRVEQQFTGAPTLLILDEAWLFLSHPVFAERLQAWLKTLRKKNVFVVFATQEVADAAQSPITATIVSACHTKIYLPDDEALTPSLMKAYQDFGLTETEIQILAGAQKKRDYYYRSVKGRRLFRLDLGPVGLAFAGMSSADDQKFLDAMVASVSPGEYAEHILRHRGLAWAADLVAEARATGSVELKS
jgi:type IV secretory pathway VirB4 component